jgi:peptidoglycan/xylan/chitin deacetylase (PgdA/CDA1 family)
MSILAIRDDFTVYVDDFEQQMATLKSKGAKFVRPQELENIVRRRSDAPEKCVLVTLDDGDVSQYQYAFPVLRREQIPFLIFVISGQIGRSDFNGIHMAAWPQLREMVASGLATVGSHTHDMHRMDSSRRPIFSNAANTVKFDEDLHSSLTAIQHELGTPIEYFAYPFGFGTPQTDEIALRAGMRLLFSLREGLVRPGDPAFFVKRVLVTPRNWQLIEAWLGRGGPSPLTVVRGLS